MEGAAAFILMVLVFPVWVAAGYADWVCHRRTGIAVTSGLKENLLHWLMYAQVGAGIAAVVFLELNAAVLAFVFAVFLVHEATVYWDLDYSTVRRDVGPFEQMVHSFLELLPLLALALLALMAWPQAQALVGLGSEPAEWRLRPRAEPLPAWYLIAAGVLTFGLNLVPLAQETWSCMSARRRPHRRGGAPEAQRGEPRIEPVLEPDARARTPESPGPR